MAHRNGSLYQLTIEALLKSYDCYAEQIKGLPDNILIDVFLKIHNISKLDILLKDFVDYDTFGRILKIPASQRLKLLECFQDMMDKNPALSEKLAQAYFHISVSNDSNPESRDSTIEFGLRLGGFLSDAGWYRDSIQVLKKCLRLCQSSQQTPPVLRQTLECYHKLLHCEALFCKFEDAKETSKHALDVIEKLREIDELPNLAYVYTDISALYYLYCDYNKCYFWALEAMKEVVPTLPLSIVIDVFRQTARVFTVKKLLKKADILIRQAVGLAHMIYDEDHYKLAEVFMDYGFYLLNTDRHTDSVEFYKKAVKIKKKVFKRRNLIVATALEDLAYALYVSEYNTGHFQSARECISEAISVLEELLPADHLMLGSAARVLALILEEIVIDNRNGTSVNNDDCKIILPNIENLHKVVLNQSIKAFGVKHLNTAKHYGNLGRLYQTMGQYDKAEDMQLKAIHIKSEILESDDYEIYLSIGHLASLYNYDMLEFKKAEALHKRAIDIALKIFGKSFSGLRFEYNGLLRIYNETSNFTKLPEIYEALSEWQVLQAANKQPVWTEKEPLAPLEDVLNIVRETNR